MDRLWTDALNRALWYDVAPMRPHEFEQVELYPFIEAEDLQRAFKDGIADADDEHAAAKRQRSE